VSEPFVHSHKHSHKSRPTLAHERSGMGSHHHDHVETDVLPCAVLINGSLGRGVLSPGAAYRVAEVREHWRPTGVEGESPVVTTVVRFDPVAEAGRTEP